MWIVIVQKHAPFPHIHFITRTCLTYDQLEERKPKIQVRQTRGIL